MCKDPEIRTPASGFSMSYFRRNESSPGISGSAMEILDLPSPARLKSLTLNARSVVSVGRWLIGFNVGGGFGWCEKLTHQHIKMR